MSTEGSTAETAEAGTGIDIEEAPRLQWRCGGCAIRPVLGVYTQAGGVYVEIHRRPNKKPAIYVVDLMRGAIDAHCPACHGWRRLELIANGGRDGNEARAGGYRIEERERPRPWPTGSGCRDCAAGSALVTNPAIGTGDTGTAARAGSANPAPPGANGGWWGTEIRR